MAREAILNKDKDFKEYTLTDYEFSYLKDLNVVLQLNVFRSKIISGFLTYVAQTRFGYTKIKEGYNLQFEVDPNSDSKTIKIKEIPIEATEPQ